MTPVDLIFSAVMDLYFKWRILISTSNAGETGVSGTYLSTQVRRVVDQAVRFLLRLEHRQEERW